MRGYASAAGSFAADAGIGSGADRLASCGTGNGMRPEHQVASMPIIVILSPLLFPVAQKLGMNPVHFYFFTVTSIGLGFVMPPMGSTCS